MNPSYLNTIYTEIIGSEYISNEFSLGSIDNNGIRKEDSTQLNFASNIFDAILSFDYLEHIPNYAAALSDYCRVLKPGGKLLITEPFRPDLYTTLSRVIFLHGASPIHLEEPEYHGDPVNDGGVLCYYHFGWDLLDSLHNKGFQQANIILYHSRAFGYLGGPHILISATK